VNVFAVMPYHLVFLDFDLMDGSGKEGGSDSKAWHIEHSSSQKYTTFLLLFLIGLWKSLLKLQSQSQQAVKKLHLSACKELTVTIKSSNDARPQ
jgi:hypothetical protein